MSDAVAFVVVHASSVQAGLFVAIIVACWASENVAFSFQRRRKRRRAAVNGLFAACALPIQIGMAIGCAGLAQWVTAHHWGLLHALPWHDSPWIRYGLMFVALDFLDYVYHVTMHHVPLFWRFHLVHHTDQAMDASTTMREHPGETFVRNGFLMAWVFLCGASLEVLVLRQSVETVANILAHTSFRLRDGVGRVLGWVLITPNLHHVHHHGRLPYTNSNYGDVFSLWDRLFGTLATLGLQDIVFGLDSHRSLGDRGFPAALALPFLPGRSAVQLSGASCKQTIAGLDCQRG